MAFNIDRYIQLNRYLIIYKAGNRRLTPIHADKTKFQKNIDFTKKLSCF